MADLPDYYTQAQIAEAEAASFDGGLDANKSATPVSRDIYLATDTHILYVCFTDGTWTGFDAAILTQGVLTLYANMLGGGFRITNIADPTAAQDAATRAYVLAQLASYLALAGGTMAGNIAMGDNKVTGLGAPTADNDAARKAYVDTLHALCLLLAGGTMSGNIAMGTNKVTGLGAPTTAGDALRYGNAEIRNTEIAAAAAIAYSKLNLTGNITNTDIAAAAAIVYSKLNLATSLLVSDIAATEFNAANKLVKLDASADIPLAQIPDTLTGKDADTVDGDDLSDIESTMDTKIGAHADLPNAHHTPPTVTREIYSTVDGFAGGDAVYSGLQGGVLINASGEEVYLQLLVPQDFTSITALEVIFMTIQNAASMHFKFTTVFGAYNGGESYAANSETGDDRDIGATTLNENNNHDIADLVTGLAAGDRLMVVVEYNDTAIDSNAYVCGLRLKYS